MPREIVTSENRAEFMEKKLAEKAGKKPKKKAEVKEAKQAKEVKEIKKEKPYGIWHSESDKLHSHYKNEAEAYEVYKNLGYKMSDHAIGELTPREMKDLGYK
jgi:predicted esterase YcpF (UPF0227 family)